jgi:hypothetical protein
MAGAPVIGEQNGREPGRAYALKNPDSCFAGVCLLFGIESLDASF